MLSKEQKEQKKLEEKLTAIAGPIINRTGRPDITYHHSLRANCVAYVGNSPRNALAIGNKHDASVGIYNTKQDALDSIHEYDDKFVMSYNGKSVCYCVFGVRKTTPVSKKYLEFICMNLGMDSTKLSLEFPDDRKPIPLSELGTQCIKAKCEEQGDKYYYTVKLVDLLQDKKSEHKIKILNLPNNRRVVIVAHW